MVDIALVSLATNVALQLTGRQTSKDRFCHAPVVEHVYVIPELTLTYPCAQTATQGRPVLVLLLVLLILLLVLVLLL